MFHIVTHRYFQLTLIDKNQEEPGASDLPQLARPIFRVEKADNYFAGSNMLVIDFFLPFDRRANVLDTADRPCAQQMSSRCAA